MYSLKRKVDKSLKYDKYIKKTSCESEDLGKGDTFKTLQLLKIWADKYVYQTKNLANKLKGGNLSVTTKKIQKFLYNTIQYKADGFEQYLLSPSCAYASRFRGLDCKSYSIFASTLLLNSGINHYFRKVQQPGDLNNYSHVYIVVPKNQFTNDLSEGYYVIDGTIREQNEVIYTKSKDKFMKSLQMPHIGLKAPNKTQTKGQKIINNFNQGLNNLELVGISQKTIIELRDTIRYYVDKGINPVLKRSKNNNGIYVNGFFVHFTKNNNGLNGVGFGGGGFDGGFGGFDVIGGGSVGSGFDFGDLFGQGGGVEQSGDIIGVGAEIGLDAITGGFGTTIADLIGIDIGESIGLIFSGQWDCIGGSAWSKNRAENNTQHLTEYLDQQINIISSNGNLSSVNSAFNNYIKYSYYYHDAYLKKLNGNNWNSCSSEAIGNMVASGQTAIDSITELKSNLENIFNVQLVRQVNNEAVDFTALELDNNNRGVSSYPVYGLTLKVSTNTNANITNTNDNTNNNNDVKGKSNAILPIAIASLAVKLLLFS